VTVIVKDKMKFASGAVTSASPVRLQSSEMSVAGEDS
jgi:hypothetical protein